MKERTLQYTFDIKLLSGKLNVASDSLSRYPVGKPDSEDEEFASDVSIACINFAINAIIQNNQTTLTTIDER